VCDWRSAATSDTDLYARYFRGMLDKGFTLAPSQFEAAFVGLAHTDEDIDAAVAAAGEVLAAL
jgi:glutamate-1-semialdehyde 2,1-aminomutase